RAQRKATKRRNGSINCAPNSAMLRFSRRYQCHRTPRKKPTRTKRGLLEVDPPDLARPITKRLCLHRSLTARFRRRLRSRRIPLPRPNLYCLRRVRAQAQALILPTLPEHRPPPKRPPHRRLESFTCDNLLPRGFWLPWLSRRAGKTVLSPRRPHHRGADV